MLYAFSSNEYMFDVILVHNILIKQILYLDECIFWRFWCHIRVALPS